MKQILLVFSFFFIFSTSFSQDYIYFLNGKKTASTVLEVSKEKIRYHAPDDPEGLVREVASREVYMITYRNGKEEIFGSKKTVRPEQYFSNGKNEYYSLSMGIGQSHGFLGVRFQHRWGGLQGWGYHAGIGISPFGTSEHPVTLNFSAGGKFFFYKGWFLGVQFGTFAIQKMKEYTPVDTSKIHNYHNNYHDDIRTACGPSIMVGGDWLFSRYFGITGDLGVSFNVSRPGFEATMVAVDLGFIYRFPGKKKQN